MCIKTILIFREGDLHVTVGTSTPRRIKSRPRRSNKRLKIESPAWAPGDQTIQSLRCFGANLRSMVAPANSYSLNKFLEEEAPDLMFVVETWHREPLLLPNRRYSILLSPTDGERAGGVGIISRYPLIVMPLFSEFHTRNLILARLSSKNTNPILLLCVYIPPDLERKKEMIGHICRVIEFLNERYSSFSLLGFGDLNTELVVESELPKPNPLTRALSQRRVKIHIYDGKERHTRQQGTHGSFLDYFFSSGVDISEIRVDCPIGRSDHNSIHCRVHRLNAVKRRRRLVFSKSRANKLLTRILDGGDFEKITRGTPLSFFRRLSGMLSSYAVSYEPRPMNYFKAIQSIDEELQSSSVDWGRVVRTINSCKGTEFIALMGKLNELRETNQMKEFHNIVGNVLRVKKKVFVAHELRDPEAPDEIIYEPDRVRQLISNKYSRLYASDCEKSHFEVGEIKPVSREEVCRAAELVSSGKGLGIDCIPDRILDVKDPGGIVIKKLTELVNLVFGAKKIPTPFVFARLHLLNKLKGETPGLEDIRPIMISSPIIKLIEALILEDLQNTLEPQICPAQVGFIPKYNTQTHILRLLGKVIDYKERATFNTGSWMILFIDFKTAFDRVDHKTLMEKLERAGVKKNTLNVIKLLYNSYHFTLPGDIPKKVNSGVAQGSLISPILYCWYVNDLVEALSKRFGAGHTFAYADDIAVLCLGYSEVREAIHITETWASANKAQMNKKKCGLLRITKRETSIGKKEIEGVPFVKEYKYLGVPLDQAFTLKHLVQLVKEG